MKNKLLLVMIALSLSAPSAFAAKREMTKEQRDHAAKMHEQMAKCLRSDKDMRDCKKEMKEACKDAGEACPMGMHRMKREKRGSKED